ASRGAAGGPLLQRSLWRNGSRFVRCARADCRYGGRPASRLVRSELLQPRFGKKHIWNRLFHADEHRRATHAVAPPVAHHGCLEDPGPDGLRARRQCVYRRGLIQSSAEIEALAASVPDCGGVYLVPAFAGLGAPHWDPYARGTITGLTLGTTAAHLARAALEGIAFQVADVLDVMKEDSGIALSELRVDGGASSNNLLMQFQADILRVPIVRPKIIETTALAPVYELF